MVMVCARVFFTKRDAIWPHTEDMVGHGGCSLAGDLLREIAKHLIQVFEHAERNVSIALEFHHHSQIIKFVSKVHSEFGPVNFLPSDMQTLLVQNY